ncbi:hypothetical protein AB4Z22_44670, partial [Paenibacillus sp. TAF58]
SSLICACRLLIRVFLFRQLRVILTGQLSISERKHPILPTSVADLDFVLKIDSRIFLFGCLEPIVNHFNSIKDERVELTL